MKLFAWYILLAGWIAGVCLGSGGCAAPEMPGTGSFQSVVRRAGNEVFPAVVYIRAVAEDRSDGKEGANIVSGSGVLISANGEVLTNFHVIDKARGIRCQLHDGRSANARVVGSDKDLDLALLQLELPENTPPLPFAELADRRAEEGEFVMAMGAPWGLARSVTIGIISCAGRYLPDHGEYTLWYQTDASISPGNSGGPLIDIDGKVIGINTLGRMIGGQIAFTIPAFIIRETVGRLRKYGQMNWAWFGFRLQALEDFDLNIRFDAAEGVIVAGTDPESPARKAGFLPNDRIVAVNGIPVLARTPESLPEIRRKLGLMPFGKDVRFQVIRDGKTLEITVAPAEKGKVEGSSAVLKQWGFSVKAINRFDNPQLHFYMPEGGVFVFGVDWGGIARGKLQQEDVIAAVNGVPMKTVEAIRNAYESALQQIDRNNHVILDVVRGGRSRQIVLQFSRETPGNGGEK